MCLAGDSRCYRQSQQQQQRWRRAFPAVARVPLTVTLVHILFSPSTSRRYLQRDWLPIIASHMRPTFVVDISYDFVSLSDCHYYSVPVFLSVQLFVTLDTTRRSDCYTYLRQGGYVIVVVCLSVCLLATLCKNVRTDLCKIFSEGWQWASEEVIKFWWQSWSPTGYRDCLLDWSLLGDTETG